MQRIAEADDVQTTLPDDARGIRTGRNAGANGGGSSGGGTAGNDDPREWQRARERAAPREGTDRGVEAPSFSGGESVGVALAWSLVVVVGVLLAAALTRAIADRSRAKDRLARPGAPTPDPGAAPPPVPDHERLAAEGRYAEAVHALLLAAFVQLAEQRGSAWPRARTGREILAAFGGFSAGEAPLQLVFRTAEAAWFGSAPVDRDGYERCLRNYRGWSGA